MIYQFHATISWPISLWWYQNHGKNHMKNYFFRNASSRNRSRSPRHKRSKSNPLIRLDYKNFNLKSRLVPHYHFCKNKIYTARFKKIDLRKFHKRWKMLYAKSDLSRGFPRSLAHSAGFSLFIHSSAITSGLVSWSCGVCPLGRRSHSRSYRQQHCHNDHCAVCGLGNPNEVGEPWSAALARFSLYEIKLCDYRRDVYW